MYVYICICICLYIYIYIYTHPPTLRVMCPQFPGLSPPCECTSHFFRAASGGAG